MTLSLIFVDDWELRGDGSGDMRRIQFDTMRELNRIYEDHGLRGSYNAEVMQQLNHLSFGERHPELKELAHEWEEIVLDTYRRGHDVQLHVHSQWSDASYEDGRWTLAGDWSIINYPRDEMARMISECRKYLEGLLQPINPGYRCVSFRAGAWAIAPNEHILSVLSDEGIVFDMSICGGIKYDNQVVNLDYTSCEETFLPYHPDPRDARRMGTSEIGLVTVPTFTFRPSLGAFLKRDFGALRRRLGPRPAQSSPAQAAQPAGKEYKIWRTDDGAVTGYWSLLKDRMYPEVRISDLSYMPHELLQDMVRSMRERARRRNITSAPIILENHSKDIANFDHIKRFVDYVSRQDDLEVITLQELARRLEAGFYPVLQRAPSRRAGPRKLFALPAGASRDQALVWLALSAGCLSLD